MKLEAMAMDMQKKIALLQVIDPITKQHTAAARGTDFSGLFVYIMNFANNASIEGGGGGAADNKQVNTVKEKTENIEPEDTE